MDNITASLITDPSRDRRRAKRDEYRRAARIPQADAIGIGIVIGALLTCAIILAVKVLA